MSARQSHELLAVQPITIHGVALSPVEYSGVRVMTLAMIDQVHQRPEGTARRNFNEHRARLNALEDFFELGQPDEIRTLGITRPQGGAPAKVVLLTETGYSMLVKSFTDDLAWDVQRQLVKSYFAKPVPAPTRKVRSTSNQSLESFRQARALEITSKVAGDLCAMFPGLGQAAQQTIYAKLINNVAGADVVPLPAVGRLYSATEIAKKYGSTAQAVGKLSVANNLKVEKYGEYVLDKSRSSAKEMSNFLYNEAGVMRIGELLGALPAAGKSAPQGEIDLSSGDDPE